MTLLIFWFWSSRIYFHILHVSSATFESSNALRSLVKVFFNGQLYLWIISKDGQRLSKYDHNVAFILGIGVKESRAAISAQLPVTSLLNRPPHPTLLSNPHLFKECNNNRKFIKTKTVIVGWNDMVFKLMGAALDGVGGGGCWLFWKHKEENGN